MLEVAPVVGDHGAAGGNVNVARKLVDFPLFLFGKQAIDGLEFVVLVFAHEATPTC